MDKKSDFLKPVEAAETLRISRSKLYEALAQGEIPSVRIAGLIRVPRAWVEQQVAQAIATVEGK